MFGQIGEVAIDAFLIGLVVIRRDDQRRIGPGGLRRVHMLQRDHGVVGNRIRRSPARARRLIHAHRTTFVMFHHGHRRRSAGGAAGHERTPIPILICQSTRR